MVVLEAQLRCISLALFYSESISIVCLHYIPAGTGKWRDGKICVAFVFYFMHENTMEGFVFRTYFNQI